MSRTRSIALWRYSGRVSLNRQSAKTQSTLIAFITFGRCLWFTKWHRSPIYALAHNAFSLKRFHHAIEVEAAGLLARRKFAEALQPLPHIRAGRCNREHALEVPALVAHRVFMFGAIEGVHAPWAGYFAGDDAGAVGAGAPAISTLAWALNASSCFLTFSCCSCWVSWGLIASRGGAAIGRESSSAMTW